MPVLGRAFIEVKADLSGFPTDVRTKLKAALEEGTAGIEFKEIGEAAEKAGEEAGTQLEKGLKKNTDTTGERVGRDIGRKMMTGMSSVFGGIGMTIIPVLIALAVEAVAALGPALAALSFAIPAAVAVAVGAFAVLKIATNGVGDALKAAFSGNQAAFDKAMEKLAPAAREFVTEVQKIRPVMHQLQQDIQQTFFVQFQGTLLSIIQNLLPQLRTGLHSIAADLGQMAKSIGGALVAGKGDIGSIFVNIHAALKPLIPALGQMVSIFLTLAAVAGPFVTTLSTRFAGLITQLGQFVQRLAASGQLAQIFDTGLVVLHQLSDLLAGVWHLLTDVFAALQSTGAGAIGLFSTLVAQLAAFFATAQGQKDLAAVFNLLNVVLTALAAILTPLLPVIAQLAGDLAGQLSVSVVALTPALVNVAQALADILGAVDPLLPAIGQLVTGIAPILNWLTQNPVLLAAAATAWGLYEAAVWAAGTAQAAFDVEAAANPIGLIVIAIAAIVAGIILLVQNWKTVKQWGSDAWNAIKDAGVAVWHWMEGIGQDISNWFQNVMDWFAALPGNIGSWLAGLPDAIGQAFQNAFNNLGEMVGLAFGLLIGEFMNLPGQIGSALSSLGSLLAGIWSDAWAWVGKETDLAWANISTFFTLLPGRIGAFISGLPGMLKGAFHTAWEWAKQEVSDGADAVVDFARKLPGRIAGFFDNIGHSILGGLKSGINSVIDSFNKGIDDAAGWTHISLPHLPHFAAGGIVDSPTLAVIGEGGSREVVLPANNPLRAQELLEQSGLMSQMKMGMQMPTINFTAYLGTGELLTVVDTRVDMKVNDQASNLTSGVRSM